MGLGFGPGDPGAAFAANTPRVERVEIKWKVGDLVEVRKSWSYVNSEKLLYGKITQRHADGSFSVRLEDRSYVTSKASEMKRQRRRVLVREKRNRHYSIGRVESVDSKAASCVVTLDGEHESRSFGLDDAEIEDLQKYVEYVELRHELERLNEKRRTNAFLGGEEGACLRTVEERLFAVPHDMLPMVARFDAGRSLKPYLNSCRSHENLPLWEVLFLREKVVGGLLARQKVSKTLVNIIGEYDKELVMWSKVSLLIKEIDRIWTASDFRGHLGFYFFENWLIRQANLPMRAVNMVAANDIEGPELLQASDEQLDRLFPGKLGWSLRVSQALNRLADPEGLVSPRVAEWARIGARKRGWMKDNSSRRSHAVDADFFARMIPRYNGF